jgi:hypothetical protein
MTRVYHKGATGTALPPAGPDRAARAVLSRPIDPLSVDPVHTGERAKINIMPAMEG